MTLPKPPAMDMDTFRRNLPKPGTPSSEWTAEQRAFLVRVSAQTSDAEAVKTALLWRIAGVIETGRSGRHRSIAIAYAVADEVLTIHRVLQAKVRRRRSGAKREALVRGAIEHLLALPAEDAEHVKAQTEVRAWLDQRATAKDVEKVPFKPSYTISPATSTKTARAGRAKRRA